MDPNPENDDGCGGEPDVTDESTMNFNEFLGGVKARIEKRRMIYMETDKADTGASQNSPVTDADDDVDVDPPVMETDIDAALALSPSPSPGRPSGRLSRMNALVSNINAWEDDLSHVPRLNPTPSKKSKRSGSMDSMTRKSLVDQGQIDEVDMKKEKRRLEKTTSSTKLEQLIEEAEELICEDLTVAEKAALFEPRENWLDTSRPPEDKNYYSMTVAERAKAFEQQQQQQGTPGGNRIGTPKAGFGKFKSLPAAAGSGSVRPTVPLKKSRPSLAASAGIVQNQRRLFESETQEKFPKVLVMEEEEEGSIDSNSEENVDEEASLDSEGSIEELQEQNTAETSRYNPHHLPTTDFNASSACRQIDALIDGALDGQSFTFDTALESCLQPGSSSTPKGSILEEKEMRNKQTESGEPVWNISEQVSRHSKSMLEKTETDVDESKEISLMKSPLPPRVKEYDEVPLRTPLLRTISTYRKQVDKSAAPIQRSAFRSAQKESARGGANALAPVSELIEKDATPIRKSSEQERLDTHKAAARAIANALTEQIEKIATPMPSPSAIRTSELASKESARAKARANPSGSEEIEKGEDAVNCCSLN